MFYFINVKYKQVENLARLRDFGHQFKNKQTNKEEKIFLHLLAH